MNNSRSTMQEVETSANYQPPSQVITARVKKEQWHLFEQKCLANQIPMSRILQQAVVDYLKN